MVASPGGPRGVARSCRIRLVRVRSDRDTAVPLLPSELGVADAAINRRPGAPMPRAGRWTGWRPARSSAKSDIRPAGSRGVVPARSRIAHSCQANSQSSASASANRVILRSRPLRTAWSAAGSRVAGPPSMRTFPPGEAETRRPTRTALLNSFHEHCRSTLLGARPPALCNATPSSTDWWIRISSAVDVDLEAVTPRMASEAPNAGTSFAGTTTRNPVADGDTAWTNNGQRGRSPAGHWFRDPYNSRHKTDASSCCCTGCSASGISGGLPLRSATSRMAC